MPIEVDCECGKSYQVAEAFAGKTINCPTCGAAIDVPKSPTAVPPDVAGGDAPAAVAVATGPPVGAPPDLGPTKGPAGVVRFDPAAARRLDALERRCRLLTAGLVVATVAGLGSLYRSSQAVRANADGVINVRGIDFSRDGGRPRGALGLNAKGDMVLIFRDAGGETALGMSAESGGVSSLAFGSKNVMKLGLGAAGLEPFVSLYDARGGRQEERIALGVDGTGGAAVRVGGAPGKAAVVMGAAPDGAASFSAASAGEDKAGENVRFELNLAADGVMTAVFGGVGLVNPLSFKVDGAGKQAVSGFGPPGAP